MSDASIDRRDFVGRVALASAAMIASQAGIAAAAGHDVHAVPPSDDWDHGWLRKLDTKHRPFFDTRSYGSEVFGYPARYRSAMVDGYGAKRADIRIVVGLHGNAWMMAIDDATWEALEIGAFASIDDPVTKARSRRNFYASDAAGDPNAANSLAAAQKLGVIVLVCNNTLLRISRELTAKKEGSNAAAIHAQLRAGVLKDVTVVPAMIAAIGLAQERGATYLSAG